MRAVALAIALSALLGVAVAQQGSTYAPTNFTAVPNSGVQLLANITALSTSPEWVKVSWSGVPRPSIYDAVAFVVPANATYNMTAPSKFFWATRNNSDYLRTGSGSANFRILNQRADFKFIFVTNVSNWLGNFTQLAETPPIPLANPNQPTQVHLYLTGTQGEMGVQWTTRDRLAHPTVRYGTSPGMYTFEVGNGTTDTYTRNDMCGGLAKNAGYMFPGIFNNVILQDLEPNTRYYYSVGSPDGGFSQEYSFLTAAPPGPTESVSFLALADLGYCEVDGAFQWPGWYVNDIVTTPPGTDAQLKTEVHNSLNFDWDEPCAALRTAQVMAQDMANRTLVIHNGDLSYALGWVYGWDVYMDMLAPILTQAPYMIVNGNHEQDWPNLTTTQHQRYPTAMDSGGECGVVTAKRFPMPAANNWYSFDYGPIHFLQWDTEIDFAPGSDQYNFMLNDLKAVNRSITPWLVVGFHRPFYTDSVYGNIITGDIGNTKDERDAWELLFYQYQVDMTWYGHVHQYSRTCPILQQNCLPNNADGSASAPVHLCIGHAGQTFSLTNNPVTPPYYVTEAIQHGYLRVLANGTTAAMEVVNSQNGLGGQLTDKFTLTKPTGWKANQTTQLGVIGTFIGNYTPTVWELHGINGPAESLVQDAAEKLLQSEPDLLNMLRNATYVQDPNAPDTMAAADQIFAPLVQIYQTQIAGTSRESPAAKYFWENYFKPLWTLYLSHPDGLLQGVEQGPSSSPVSASQTSQTTATAG